MFEQVWIVQPFGRNSWMLSGGSDDTPAESFTRKDQALIQAICLANACRPSRVVILDVAGRAVSELRYRSLSVRAHAMGPL